MVCAIWGYNHGHLETASRRSSRRDFHLGLPVGTSSKDWFHLPPLQVTAAGNLCDDCIRNCNIYNHFMLK